MPLLNIQVSQRASVIIIVVMVIMINCCQMITKMNSFQFSLKLHFNLVAENYTKKNGLKNDENENVNLNKYFKEYYRES